MTTFFNGYDGLLCDLDGVVYAGTTAIDSAVETLNSLQARGIPVAFVTNNASRAAQEVADRLTAFGVITDAYYVMTSAQAVVDALASSYEPTQGPVLVTGSEQLGALITAAGFSTTKVAKDLPQVVVQGFNPQLGWEDLAQASFAIQQGAGWLASNLDLSIPLAEGVAPGNGSLVNAVAQATGTRPEIVAGKPAALMFTTMAQRFGMQHPLVVGDRLDTDVLGAAHAGFHGALVETGIHSRGDVATFREVATPAWILPNLRVLLTTAQDQYRGSHV